MFKSSVAAIPRAIQLDGANKKSAKRIGLQSVFGDQGIPDICIFSATVVVTNISTRGRQSKLFLGSYASDPYIYMPPCPPPCPPTGPSPCLWSHQGLFQAHSVATWSTHRS